MILGGLAVPAVFSVLERERSIGFICIERKVEPTVGNLEGRIGRRVLLPNPRLHPQCFCSFHQ